MADRVVESRSGIDINRILSYLVLISIGVLVLLPLIPILIWAFSERWFFPEIIPPEFTLKAWGYLAEPASGVAKAAVTGATVAISATLISLVIGIPAGRALGLYNFRGKKLVYFLILAPVIVPAIAAVMGIHVFFLRLGLASQISGVTLSHLIGTVPYVVIVMSSVFANYDPEYEEQARSLGANTIRTFIHVTFPSISAGILVAGFFAFIISWGNYLLTLLISGGRVITVPLLMVTFAYARHHTFTAALCIIFLVPSVLFLFITSKYLTGENSAMGGFGA